MGKCFRGFLSFNGIIGHSVGLNDQVNAPASRYFLICSGFFGIEPSQRGFNEKIFPGLRIAFGSRTFLICRIISIAEDGVNFYKN